jgi:hypothetical protein
MKKATQDDLAEISSVFGDLRYEELQDWWAENRGAIEGLEINDIPIGDFHTLAERIREWKKRKSN